MTKWDVLYLSILVIWAGTFGRIALSGDRNVTRRIRKQRKELGYDEDST